MGVQILWGSKYSVTDPALATQNIGIYLIQGLSNNGHKKCLISLSGHLERTNTVVVLHMAGAKKNVVYFPGDTQVSNYY